MPIKNLSDKRRIPRAGKIHLGIKRDKKKDGTPCASYPTEVDYFVCPPEVQAVFGEKPRTLKIMIPVEEDERFFPFYYKRYTVNLLQCRGDGEKASCWGENRELQTIPCPCEYLKTGECKPIGIFNFVIPGLQGFDVKNPDIQRLGVYQISTSSKNSYIDIMSGLDMVRAFAGRVRMIPLILKREKMEIQRFDEGGKPKKSTHYTMKIDIDVNTTFGQLQILAKIKPEEILLPPPDESKDDLFYPANGFKPEGGVLDTEVEGEKKDELSDEAKRIAALRDELATVIAGCERSGMKLKAEAWDQINALKDEADYKKAIKTFRDRLTKMAKKVEDQDIPF